MARIKISLPKQLSFSTEIPVRVGDINYGGHVGNDSILSIMHEARMQFFRNIGCKDEAHVFGKSLIMGDVGIQYMAEAFYGDILKVEMQPDEFTSRSFELFYRISIPDTEKTIAKAKTGMVCFDYDSRKVDTLPQEFLALWNISS